MVKLLLYYPFGQTPRNTGDDNDDDCILFQSPVLPFNTQSSSFSHPSQSIGSKLRCFCTTNSTSSPVPITTPRRINDQQNCHKTIQTSLFNSSISVSLLNARSVPNKVISICEFLRGKQIIACGLTETWLTGNDSVVCAECNELGFSILHCPRKTSKRGGVGFLYKSNLVVKRCKSKSFTTCENLEVTLKGKNKTFIFSTIYRTGLLTLQNQVIFLKEFEEHVQSIITKNMFIVLWGDFNIHVEKQDDSLAINFLHLMETLGFKQLINQPTHLAGGTLDLIFIRHTNDVNNVVVHNDDVSEQLSDHYVIQAQLPDRPLHEVKTLRCTFRQTTSIIISLFKCALRRKNQFYHCY